MKKIIIFAMMFLLLISSSCKKNSSLANSEGVENTVENNYNTNYNLREGIEMPNVVAQTNKDETFDLSSIDKPALINFWATWCPPCREEMPSLQSLYEEYGDRIEFVMINEGESKEAIQDFLVENEFYTFPIGYDEENIYALKFNLIGIPTTCIVGKDKKIKNYIVGGRPKEQFREYIEKAINE